MALLQRGDATSISSLLYLVPPLAMFIAWAILGEAVTKLALAGFALSAAGVYIVISDLLEARLLRSIQQLPS